MLHTGLAPAEDTASESRHQYWDEKSVPHYDAEEFLCRLKRSTNNGARAARKAQTKNAENESDQRDAECPFSFGNEGTTATVNAYGQVMRFASYLGVGKSGMASVTHNRPEWFLRFLPNRRDHERHGGIKLNDFAELVSSTNLEDLSFGLKLQDLVYDKPPRRSCLVNRWPQYDFENSTTGLTVQWTIHQGSLIQRCLLVNKHNEDRPVDFSFSKDMWLQNSNLDSIERKRRYDSIQGPGGCSWVFIAHSKDDNVRDPNDPECMGIGVMTTIFVDGVACVWNDDASWRKILPGNPDQGAKSHELEVVTAYKLMSIGRTPTAWTDFIIHANDIDAGLALLDIASGSVSFASFRLPVTPEVQSRTDHQDGRAQANGFHEEVPRDLQKVVVERLNVIILRHLEHILSVCSIPVPLPARNAIGYAITTGDISDHKIWPNSAIFFAFRFLLAVARHLRSLPPGDAYVESLASRIKAVCVGHLLWLKSADPIDFDNVDNELHLPSGKKGNARCVFKYPNYLPFRIIMTAEFADTFQGENENLVHDVLKDLRKPWLHYLQKIDSRRKCTWPRHIRDVNESDPADAPFKAYRLDDHIWIYESLRRLENMRVKDPLQDEPRRDFRHKSVEARRMLYLQEIYASHRVLNEIIQRFTVEVSNDLPHRRMLAVTRSLNESRFLLHAKDTILFEVLGTKEASLPGSWASTIQAQACFVENDENKWDNALRYGLAIVMAAQGFSITGKPPGDIIRIAVKTLLDATSYNGLVPGILGQIQEGGRFIPDVGNERRHYHGLFEVPYVLLTHMSDICLAFDNDAPIANLGESETTLGISETLQKPLLINHGGEYMRKSSPNANQLQAMAHLKAKVPLNNRVESSNVSSLEDEWLYNLPVFFRNEPIETEEILHSLKREIKRNPNAVSKVVANGIHFDYKRTNFRTACILNIPKRRWALFYSLVGLKEWPGHFYEPEHLQKSLARGRTPGGAKRRIIIFSTANPGAALACYLTAPEADRAAISTFFDRHAYYENLFFEDIQSIRNIWETELHLSFYVVGDATVRNRAGLPTPVEEKFPKLSSKRLKRASMSLRFLGDFFDRYWTCWLVAYDPRDQSFAGSGISSLFPEYVKPNDRSCRQRRVMELMFVDAVIASISLGAKSVVETVCADLEIKPEDPSSTTWQDDASADEAVHWQKYKRILNLVHASLKQNMQAISDWSRKGEVRRKAKPGWSGNDERKYGTIITKMEGNINRRIGELANSMDNVKSVIDIVQSIQEQAQSERSRKESRNVLYFTYVTVVFQPLAFATGLFSMSGSPDGPLVTSMAICAVIAFIVTIFALFNVDGLIKMLRRGRLGFNRWVRARSRAPSDRARKTTESEKHSVKTAKGVKDTTTGSDTDAADPSKTASSSVLSLMTYFFITLPVKRIALAHIAMRKGVWSWRLFVHVSSAIMVLPLLVITWSVRLVAYMVLDILRLCKEIIMYLFSLVPSSSPDPKTNVDDEKRQIDHLMALLDVARPLDSARQFIENKRHGRAASADQSGTTSQPKPSSRAPDTSSSVKSDTAETN